VLLVSLIPVAGRGIDLADTVLYLQNARAMATDLAGQREDADLDVLARPSGSAALSASCSASMT
jgi:hypothetical protein